MPNSLILLSELLPSDHITVPPGRGTYGREGHMEGRDIWKTLLEVSFHRTCGLGFTVNKSDLIVIFFFFVNSTPLSTIGGLQHKYFKIVLI